MQYSVLDTIKNAARARVLLRITYLEKDGTNEGWKIVEPYSFRGEGEEEALFAWDVGKNGIRRFTLHRITHAELMSNHFRPQFPIEII